MLQESRRSPRGLVAAALALLAAAYAVNLAAPGLLVKLAPDCPFLAITGVQCALCGSARALSSLGRGEWRAALALNPLAVLGAAAAPALGGLMATRRGATLLRGRTGRYLAGSAIVLAGAFWIWRILGN